MNEMKKHDEMLERAMKLGKEQHPDAPKQHHVAFANSVAALVTKLSGGYGGPSMREHWAIRAAYSSSVKKFDFDSATKAVEEACYGPLTINHALMLEEEACFDDPPEEIRQAQKMIQEQLKA